MPSLSHVQLDYQGACAISESEVTLEGPGQVQRHPPRILVKPQPWRWLPCMMVLPMLPMAVALATLA